MHPAASTRPAFALKQGLSRNLDGTERLAPPGMNPGHSSETKRPREIIDRSSSISHAMSPRLAARRDGPQQPDQRRWRRPVPPPRRHRSPGERAFSPGDARRPAERPYAGHRRPLTRQDPPARRPAEPRAASTTLDALRVSPAVRLNKRGYGPCAPPPPGGREPAARPGDAWPGPEHPAEGHVEDVVVPRVVPGHDLHGAGRRAGRPPTSPVAPVTGVVTRRCPLVSIACTSGPTASTSPSPAAEPEAAGHRPATELNARRTRPRGVPDLGRPGPG